jgi:hypothetical protein
MKTLLSLVIIGAIFVITPSAIAGSPKPPDRLCLEWESNSNYHHLSIDSSGKIYDKDNKIDTYVITGVDQYGIITGSGYIARGTRTLIATYSGMHSGDALSTYQLQYNLTTKSGTIYYRYDVPADNEPITGNDIVSNIGCQQLNIPPPE